MTTYDFIVHEQKRQRDKSPAADAAPAAEINTEVVEAEAEDETGRGRCGSGEEEGGVDKSPDAAQTSKEEQLEMTMQMSIKKLEQKQQRTMHGDVESGAYHVPDPDPIVDLYNRQQRQLPQSSILTTNLLNDFIPSRLPREFDTPDKGGISSSASSVSSGSHIEFYADQYAFSQAYSVANMSLSAASSPSHTKTRQEQAQGLAQREGQREAQTLNSTWREGQGLGQGGTQGGVGIWNVGPKSVSQLEQDSPKNKVSIWTRKPSAHALSLAGLEGSEGGGSGSGSAYDREEVKYFIQPSTPPPRPIYHGGRIPVNKVATGLPSPIPINPFADSPACVALEKSLKLWDGEEEKDVSKNTHEVK